MTETGQGHEVVNAAENVIGNCNYTLCAFYARQTDKPVCFCKKNTLQEEIVHWNLDFAILLKLNSV